MSPWTFYDFLDGRGNNLIREWMDGLPQKAAAKIDARLVFMQAIRTWPEQYVSALVGWPDIFEMRVVSAGSQYRPLFFYGPDRGQVTLLLGAVEKGTLPRGVLGNAESNRRIVMDDRSRIARHVFRRQPTAR